MDDQDSWQDVVRRTADYLKLGEKAVQMLAHMRMSGGSPLAVALSGMGIASQLIDTFMPAPSVWAHVTKLGFSNTPWSSVFDHMVVDWLNMHPTATRVTHKIGNYGTIYEFPDFGMAVVSTANGSAPGASSAMTLYVRNGADTDAATARLVDECFWLGGDQEATLGYEQNRGAKVQFRPLPEPVPAYLGDPSAESVVADLPRDGRSHTVFFYGPSGSGKSSLARQVARLVNPKGRMLRVSTKSFGSWELPLLRQMLTLLRPNVLLVDDIQAYLRGRGGGIDTLIEQLEGVNQVASGVLILGTIMTKSKSPPMQEGLRPGRVDRWVRLREPDAVWRRKILASYIGREPPPYMVECTEGLTGASLSNLAQKYLVRPGTWRQVVSEMRLLLEVESDGGFQDPKVLSDLAQSVRSDLERDLDPHLRAKAPQQGGDRVDGASLAGPLLVATQRDFVAKSLFLKFLSGQRGSAIFLVMGV